MEKIDDELVNGCQRYLDELEKRSKVLNKQKEEQAQVEKQKAARREYWRKMLYDDNNQGVTVVIPDDSQIGTK